MYLSTCVSPSVAQLSETQTLLRNLDNGAEVSLFQAAHGLTTPIMLTEGSRYSLKSLTPCVKEHHSLHEDICAMHTQIYLVGTAHVSKNSAEEVRELINIVKPSTVMVELCRKRADKLRSNSQVSVFHRYAKLCE